MQDGGVRTLLNAKRGVQCPLQYRILSNAMVQKYNLPNIIQYYNQTEVIRTEDDETLFTGQDNIDKSNVRLHEKGKGKKGEGNIGSKG